MDTSLTDAADSFVLGLALTRKNGKRPRSTADATQVQPRWASDLRCEPMPCQLRLADATSGGATVEAAACATIGTVLSMHGVCHGGWVEVATAGVSRTLRLFVVDAWPGPLGGRAQDGVVYLCSELRLNLGLPALYNGALPAARLAVRGAEVPPFIDKVTSHGP